MGGETPHVFSAIRMKQPTTYSYSVLWPHVYGGLWLFALEQTLYLGTFNITKSGSRKLSQMGRMSTTLGSRLSAGPYGNVETEPPLMEEESNILLKFSYMHVLSCLIGQGYKRRKDKHMWLLEWRQCSRLPTSCWRIKPSLLGGQSLPMPDGGQTGGDEE
jgi:hypothetical protein